MVVSQEVVDYASATTAAKLVAAIEKGLGCRTGRIGKLRITLVPVKTATAGGLKVLKRWDAAVPAQDDLATFVLIAKGSTAELLSFVATKAAANSIDVGTSGTAAIQKLRRG